MASNNTEKKTIIKKHRGNIKSLLKWKICKNAVSTNKNQ